MSTMRRLNHPVYRTRLLQAAADALLVALAYYLAFRLRFLDRADLPHRYWVLFAQSVGFVAVIEVAVFAAFGLYQKWWRYVSGRDFLTIVRAVAVASAIIVVLFTVLKPFKHTLPRSVAVMDFLLTLFLVAGARLAVRLIVERPDARPPRAQARGAGDRRRLGRPDGRPRDASQPQPGRDRDRLRRRRRAQAGNADARPQGAGDDGADRDDPRRDRARRGGDRDPLGAGDAAGQGRRRLPRARDPRPHPADRVRAAARRRPAQQAAARGPGRGRARPRPDRRRARPGRRLPARPHRPRHRRRRLDRLRALPPDRPRRPAPAGHARPRRGQPLRDRAGDGRGAPLQQRRGGARRLQGAAPDAGDDAALQAERRLPRRRLQARAADGGQPAGGRPQQRDRHPDHRRDGRRLRGRALRPDLDRQGGQPADGDGRLQGDGRVDRRGGRSQAPRHPLRQRPLRQRARLLGQRRADLPRPDRARRAGHRHPSGDDPLLHDDSGGGAARDPRRRHRRRQGRGLRPRHGRAGEDRRPRQQHDPPRRLRAGGARSRSSSPSRGRGRSCTRSCSAVARSRGRRRRSGSTARCARRRSTPSGSSRR